MAEYTNIQLAQADINTTATTQAVNNSRDFHDTIGEGLLVTATGIGVVFAVLVIMIVFINLFKALEPVLHIIKQKLEELECYQRKQNKAVTGLCRHEVHCSLPIVEKNKLKIKNI